MKLISNVMLTVTCLSTITTTDIINYLEKGNEVGDVNFKSNYYQTSNNISPIALLKNPSYIIMAPRVLRAGQVYKLVVNILPPSPAIVIRATLLKDNIHIDTTEQECHHYEPHVLKIKVHDSSSNGEYRLRIEGNEVGWLTGSLFKNETKLLFSPRSATVLIQTDKTIYRQGTKVNIRIFALDGSLNLIKDSVDVFLLSPRGTMVKRWLSRQCRQNVISLNFGLSKQAEEGQWTIRVEAPHSFAEKSFHVEYFEDPLFETRVDIPPFMSWSDEFLEGRISANYTSGAPVAGNISVSVSISPLHNGLASFYRTQPVILNKKSKFSGIFPFRFYLSDLDGFLNWKETLEVRIEATVGDAMWDTSHTAFSSVRIYNSKVNLKIMGDTPFIIRPTMPFNAYIVASMEDGSQVPGWRLAHHRMMISPEIRFTNGEVRRLVPRTINMAHDTYSLWKVEMEINEELLGTDDITMEVESMYLTAELKDSSGSKSFASLVAVVQHSTKGRHLQVSTSTKSPRVGEYIIFHVRSNFYLEKFRYILLSKDVIVETGQEVMQVYLRTFPIALRPEMAGMTTLIVYTMERGQEMVSDAIVFPVSALQTDKLKLGVESLQFGRMLKIRVEGEPGSTVSLSGSSLENYMIGSSQDISEDRVAEQILSDVKVTYEGETSTIDPLLHKWEAAIGNLDKYLWLSRASLGIDSNSTFHGAGLQVISDGNLPSKHDYCERAMKLPCAIRGCYSKESECDGNWDCYDRIDEFKCRGQSMMSSHKNSYQLLRHSRSSVHFEDPWLWNEVKLGKSGLAMFSVIMPERTCSLVLSAFSIHPRSGLTVLKEPMIVKTSPGIWLHVDAPSKAGLWEQVGIKVTVVNHLNEEISAIIILAKHKSYKFINLEQFQMAQYQRTPLHPVNSLPVKQPLDEEHEHKISIFAGSSHSVALPIMLTELGEIEVTVEAIFSGKKVSKSATILVEPIGLKQEHHTSLSLDLSNRPYLFTFLDIRRTEPHVKNSAKSHVSIFGEWVGSMPYSDRISPTTMLGLPEVGCEPAAFSFLMTILQLNNWKEMEQNPEKNEKKIFRDLALLYQTLLSYQNLDGGFRYYKYSSPSSVWLTALTLRAFNEASTRWPYLLYIDPQVTDKAIRFILKKQSAEGSFIEPDYSIGVRHMDGRNGLTVNSLHTKGLNLSTTAFTVMQLLSLKQLPAPLDSEVSRSITKAKVMLENKLDHIAKASNPIEVSFAAFILQETNSKLAERAFAILARNARQEVKYVYWGEDLVPLPSYRIESQRPHLQPRKYQRHDSGNIAATALALRVYDKRGELFTASIIRWLNSQRAHDAGWMSTMDTLLAWEAMYEYSKKNKERNVLLTVSVEPMEPISRPRIFYVTPENTLHIQKHEFQDLRGSLRVQGKGNGSAVLQLTSSYHSTTTYALKKPPTKAFRLLTKAISSGRNASSLTFHSCIKWLFLDASEFSGMSVLEINLPTGYGVHSRNLRQYVESRTVSNLKEAIVEMNKVLFFFDKIGQKDTCIEFSANRWFPVANLTKVLPVKVYEYYSPELFANDFLDMSSITLDICQVCGSYQCPNCPLISYYSSSSASVFTKEELFNLIVISVISRFF